MPLPATDAWLRSLPPHNERYALRIIRDGPEGIEPAPGNIIATHILKPDLGHWQGAAGLFALIHEDSCTRIAPLHGALCAAVFPHLPQRLAQEITISLEPLGHSYLIGIILSAIEQNSMTVVQSLKEFLDQATA